MCGIAGCYQQVDGDDLVRSMVATMVHRGPDDEGVLRHVSDRVSVQLGFRRLSIIDLSEAAHQPFQRGNLSLCYNGELYNYRDLRSELTSHGVRFTTSSDTEVVLEAWRRWGPGALTRFRGMFALALFDQDTGRLVLARDPLGIKPMHYLPRKDGVVFASELKSIVHALGTELRADPAALVASLLFYWIPPQQCSIEGVEKVPPGSWVEFRPDGTSAQHIYWSVTDVAARAQAGPQADLGAVIEEAVAAHLVADVPISTFLSGGLDSSIVTVLAQRSLPSLDAYTITFRSADRRVEAMPDDAAYARGLARRFGITLHEIEADPDVADLLPRMVDMLDEPIGDPAAINTYLISRAARDRGVKVMLSGMGADELFGGYRKHLACLTADRYRRLPRLPRQAVSHLVDRLPVVAGGRGLRYVRWAKRFMTFAEQPEAAAFRRSYTLYDTPALKALINPELAGHVDLVTEHHDAVYLEGPQNDPVNRMCLADTRLFLPGLNLTYTDRASMAASVEVRVPFVDPEVVAAAFSIPGREKIRGRVAKAPLKQAARAWLPDAIIDRPKASFGVPLRAWMSRDLRPLVDEQLLRGDLVNGGWLDRQAVQTLVDEDRSGREDRSYQLWQLLTLELWTKNARSAGVTL